MRSVLRLAFAGLIGVAGLVTPLVAPLPKALAAAQPKVVIIVGPVGSLSDSYRAEGEAAAAAALKYTSNVIKLYTPNATWAVVKPALQGATVVIYFGHGNGFPSPYSKTLMPDRQDGLGLNPVAGSDDATTKYWGEQYLASDVRLAANAVVMLGHLCYASGSSEPGLAAPTLEVAKQRVDNFAAGFVAAGAVAVFADAHGKAVAQYVDALFSTHQSIGQLWAGAKSSQGNPFSFPSTRTPGMTAEMDPDKGSGEFHRSIVGNLDLQTDADIGGAGTTATGGGSVGGGSSTGGSGNGGTVSIGPTPTPTPAPTPVSAPTPSPTPAPAQGGTTTQQPEVVSIGPAPAVAANAPTLSNLKAPKTFSPNGDGRQDTASISAKTSTAVAWQLTIAASDGSLVDGAAGTGDAVAITWDGTRGGARLPDGAYTWRVTATDALGSAPLNKSGTVAIDTRPPLLDVAGMSASATATPDGAGTADNWVGTFRTSEAGTVDATVTTNSGLLIRQLSAQAWDGTTTLKWDWRASDGTAVADGQYVMTLSVRDAAGNPSPPLAVPLTVFRALSTVLASKTLFYPQDRDGYAPSTRLSFQLTVPAIVTWTIADTTGNVVFTRYQNTPMAARSVAWIWTGVDQAGNQVAPGRYFATVAATNGTLRASATTALTVAAFAISTSLATAVRGQNLTVTAVSAEPLSGSPRLTVRQTGFAARTVVMTRVDSNTWRATLRLASGGGPGSLALQVSGTDLHRGSNIATANVPLK